MRYFLWPSLISLLVLGVFLGLTQSLEGFSIVLLLAVLEITISFDNAIVNAKVLGKMDLFWRRIFFWIGLPIAVFGVRFLLPFLLVSLTSNLNLWEAFNLAIYQPEIYQAHVFEQAGVLYAFGSGFLIWVCLSFLFNKRLPAETHRAWFKFEKSKWANWVSKNYIFLFFVFILIAGVLSGVSKNWHMGLGFLLGVFLQRILYALGENFSHKAMSGFLLFIYLELLDASFSLDGVLGAFAFTANPWIILAGLGIGAIFVRSMTLQLLDKKTLQNFVYLEHGAHYAIGVLGIVLGLEIFMHVPPALTAILSLGLIGKAFYDSKKIK